MRLGRIVRVLKDTNRQEFFSSNNEKRNVVISIFYEADKEAKFKEKSFYKDLFAPNEEEFIKRFEDNIYDSDNYLSNIEIKTFNDAPITKENKKFPIILFSGGLGMGRDFYMFNIEALVESGYIVVTIEHIYDSEFTVLPEGKVGSYG